MTMARRTCTAVRIAAVAAPLAAALAGGCDSPAPPAVTSPISVVVEPARTEDVPLQFEFSSTLQAIRSVQFVPRVSGYIQTRDFVEGAAVKAGDLLYQIDPRPFEAELAQHRAQLDANEAQQRFQEAELERAGKAYDQGAASENERLQYIAQAKEAAAAVQATKAQITSTELELEYARITAPFDGRIQNTLIDVGNLVTAEKSILTTLVQMDPIYAKFNVSRESLDLIQAMVSEGLVAGSSGPDTWKTLTTRLVLADGTEYEHEGHVDFVAAQIDPTTDMLMARAVFPNPGQGAHGVTLVPGQYIRIRVHLGHHPDAVVVPSRAIVETQSGTSVFVVGQAGVVERRLVTLGASHGHDRIIEHGVAAGERVVVEGMQKVRNGVTVRIAEPSSVPVPPAAPTS